MANSQEIIEAAADNDLLERALALGLGLGIAESGVRDAFKRIVAGPVEIDGTTTSVAAAYATAKATYDEAIQNLPPAPGKNLSVVTDAALEAAIQQHSYMVVP